MKGMETTQAPPLAADAEQLVDLHTPPAKKGRIPYTADRRKPLAPTVELVVDFAGMLLGLRRSGYRINAIAIQASVSRTSLRNYLAGDTMPLHPHGERLIMFWCEVTGSPRDAVPMRRALLRMCELK
jgi:hypothetical protein